MPYAVPGRPDAELHGLGLRRGCVAVPRHTLARVTQLGLEGYEPGLRRVHLAHGVALSES